MAATIDKISSVPATAPVNETEAKRLAKSKDASVQYLVAQLIKIGLDRYGRESDGIRTLQNVVGRIENDLEILDDYRDGDLP